LQKQSQRAELVMGLFVLNRTISGNQLCRL